MNKNHWSYRAWIYILTLKYVFLRIYWVSDKDIGQGTYSPNLWDDPTLEQRKERLERNVPNNLCGYIRGLVFYAFVQAPITLIALSAATIITITFVLASFNIPYLIYTYGLDNYITHSTIFDPIIIYFTTGVWMLVCAGTGVLAVIMITNQLTKAISSWNRSRPRRNKPAKKVINRTPVFEPIVQYVKDWHNGICRHLVFVDDIVEEVKVETTETPVNLTKE